jgi:hypothetical protein
MADERQERVTDATREVAERDAHAEHGAPEVPTPEEEAAAPTSASPEVAEAYEEYLDTAADAQGEGRIP